MSSIPAELVPFVSEFELPSGGRLRRMTARDYGLEGWVVALGEARFLYADGIVHSRPRHRAYEEMGCPGGEDDFHTDEQWRQAEELTERFSRMLVLSLADAYRLAAEHGVANRHARAGETATLRRTGETVTVLDGGGDDDRASIRWVPIRRSDGSETMAALSSLRLVD